MVDAMTELYSESQLESKRLSVSKLGRRIPLPFPVEHIAGRALFLWYRIERDVPSGITMSLPAT